MIDESRIAADIDVALTRLPMLGSIAWLLARSQDRRFMFVSDLEWFALPAIMLDQCRLFSQEKMPFAFVMWAFVSDDVHERIKTGVTKLAPHEWRSGDHLWIIDVLAPFGQSEAILDEVHRINFPERETISLISFDPILRVPVVREHRLPMAPAAPSAP